MSALVRTLDKLAAELGVSRQTLWEWRRKFPHDAPKPERGLHNVDKWKRFAFENALRPTEAWETADGVTPGESSGARLNSGWDDRRGTITELMELLHSAFLDGEISADEFRSRGEDTLEVISKLNTAWDAGLQFKVFARDWRECLAKAC